MIWGRYTSWVHCPLICGGWVAFWWGQLQSKKHDLFSQVSPWQAANCSNFGPKDLLFGSSHERALVEIDGAGDRNITTIRKLHKKQSQGSARSCLDQLCCAPLFPSKKLLEVFAWWLAISGGLGHPPASSPISREECSPHSTARKTALEDKYLHWEDVCYHHEYHCYYYYTITLWKFNIATENHHLHPFASSITWPVAIAMLNNQRVCSTIVFHDCDVWFLIVALNILNWAY